MARLLILEAGLPQALAIAKFLKKYSNFEVIGQLERRSLWIRKSSYDGFIVGSLSDINLSEYDYVLPTGANSTFRLLNKIGILQYKNGITFSRSNIVVFNKIHTLKLASNIGIPTPITYLEEKDIKIFPIFFKEDFEKGGGVRGIAYSVRELPKREGLIFQELIPSSETYGVGFLSKNGKIITYTIHKEILSIPPEGGSAVVVEIYTGKKSHRLLEYTARLTEFLNYNGWGLAEYKYCPIRDDVVFMELNAKFWASIELALLSNPYFLKYLFNVTYERKEVRRVVFLDRVLASPFGNIIKSFKYMLGSRLVVENNLTYLGYLLLKKFIPELVISYIKEKFYS